MGTPHKYSFRIRRKGKGNRFLFPRSSASPIGLNILLGVFPTKQICFVGTPCALCALF